MSLDDIDKQILSLLQEDAKMTASNMSKKIGSPITTIYSRIKRLEDSGVIKGYKPVLDYGKLQRSTTAFIFANFDRQLFGTAGYEDYSVFEAVSMFPEVQEVHIISGEWDLLIKVKVIDSEAIGEFIMNKLKLVPGLMEIISCMVLRTGKEIMDISLSDNLEHQRTCVLSITPRKEEELRVNGKILEILP